MNSTLICIIPSTEDKLEHKKVNKQIKIAIKHRILSNLITYIYEK